MGMNEKEKIGMYTRNEIFEHLCENSDIGMLGRSMYDAVMSKIDNLQSQLATYKDKEDKIREYIKNSKFLYDIDGEEYIDYLLDVDEILQILNEGDK